jgi:hypothetical protein
MLMRFFKILLWLFLTINVYSQDTVPIYIIGGQSNTGSSWVGNVNDPYPEDSSKFLAESQDDYIYNPFWDTSYYGNKQVPRWEKLYLGHNTSNKQAVPNDTVHNIKFGPEVSMSYYMDSIYVIKIASNSTSILFYTSSQPRGSSWFYTNLYRAFNQLYLLNKIPILKGYIQIQSESDCDDLAKSNNYGNQVDSVFTQFEYHYQFLCDKYNFPDSTATYKKIIFETKSACTYLEIVEQHKIDYCASHENAIYWEVDKYPLRYDNLHYTILGVLSQGIDLATFFNTGVLPF